MPLPFSAVFAAVAAGFLLFLILSGFGCLGPTRFLFFARRASTVFGVDAAVERVAAGKEEEAYTPDTAGLLPLATASVGAVAPADEVDGLRLASSAEGMCSLLSSIWKYSRQLV